MNVPEKQRRRKRSKRFEKSLVRAFSVEIMIGLIFLFGVFLLFEDMEIKTTVFHGIVSFFQWTTNGFSSLLGAILGTADAFETSDIVGTTLIIIAFLLLTYRVRQKAILRFHELSECPDCGCDLIHVHRNNLQKLAGWMFLLKIRRYSCKECDFEGLRMRSKKSR